MLLTLGVAKLYSPLRKSAIAALISSVLPSCNPCRPFIGYLDLVYGECLGKQLIVTLTESK